MGQEAEPLSCKRCGLRPSFRQFLSTGGMSEFGHVLLGGQLTEITEALQALDDRDGVARGAGEDVPEALCLGADEIERFVPSL